MGDVYASAMGTTVVRHKTIPKRPARLDGELVVLVDGNDVVTAEQEAALTAELAKHGAVENVRREPGRLRVRLASHAAAEAAAAAGVAGAVAVFPFWNDRDYEVRPCHSLLPNSLHSPPFLSLLQNRGWCCLETGVSGEAIACAQHFKGLDAVLKRLPPKIIEIDGDGPREADADEVGGGDEGRGPRIERVRASIKAATFTSNYDKEKVVGLYNDYIAKINNAMVNSGAQVDDEYEGEYNAAGQREGYGTSRWADGDVYEGQWKAGKMNGRGTYRSANGNVYEGEFKGGKPEGCCTYWHADGHIYEGKWKDGCDGLSIYRYSDGGVFEGEFKANKMDGPGTLRAADGSIVVGFFRESAPRAFIVSGCSVTAGTLVGEGVKWSVDGQTAWRVRDGKEVEKFSLEEARRVAAEHGLPQPEVQIE